MHTRRAPFVQLYQKPKSASTLQKRRNMLEARLVEAGKKLKSVLDRWNTLQPPVLTSEARLSMDTEGYDLSPARIREAQKTLDDLGTLCFA